MEVKVYIDEHELISDFEYSIKQAIKDQYKEALEESVKYATLSIRRDLSDDTHAAARKVYDELKGGIEDYIKNIITRELHNKVHSKVREHLATICESIEKTV